MSLDGQNERKEVAHHVSFPTICCKLSFSRCGRKTKRAYYEVRILPDCSLKGRISFRFAVLGCLPRCNHGCAVVAGKDSRMYVNNNVVGQNLLISFEPSQTIGIGLKFSYSEAFENSVHAVPTCLARTDAIDVSTSQGEKVDALGLGTLASDSIQTR